MALTPMMQQYLDVKKQYSDYIVMFRLGDFYEMFFEDAITVSKELKLTLTGKSCGLEERAPMCGVPHHAVNPYITKLISLGYKIVICEQVEDPKLTKGIVKREVSRIITPGTNQNLDIDKNDSNNYLCSIAQIGNKIGVAFIDVTTGKFLVTETDTYREVEDELNKYRPVEIIYNIQLAVGGFPIIDYCKDRNISCSELDSTYFDDEEAKRELCRQFKIEFVDALGIDKLSMLIAAGSIIKYIHYTQKSFLGNIIGINIYSIRANMVIDSFTIRNLELVETMRDAKKHGSLFWVLDKTNTSMGARFLRNEILAPSLDKALILKRYDSIDELNEDVIKRDDVREILSNIYDLERLIAKISTGSINPRDMLALSQSLQKIEPLKNTISGYKSKYIKDINKNIDLLNDLSEILINAIDEEAPISIREGRVIKHGYNKEIDELRLAMNNGKDWILDIEKEEKERTGIKNLRIKYSKNFGYCIEINKSFAEQVPQEYVRRQTLTNAERYTFEKLKEIEEKIIGAEDKLYRLELEIFEDIKSTMMLNVERILNTAKHIAELDFIISLSYIATTNNYKRPQIVNDGSIEIKGGRHPVIEKIIGNDKFIENDLYLNMKNERFAIITGPNMSGKSTYMRQTAIIVLLAQIGSFVPASECKLDIVDRIFTRVGASDDLASGQSTFMVEMTEVSNILRNATSRSLLILDEIGRGTSTFDGLSLAWSIVEYIADPNIIGAKTLFATHYHELTELEGKLDNVVNYFIDVYEKNDNVIFLRKILRGGANKSYGIQVAKLAGLPEKVIERAKELAKRLDKADIVQTINKDRKNQQISIFEYIDTKQEKEEDITDEIKKLSLDDMSPREALDFLYELKKRI